MTEYMIGKGPGAGVQHKKEVQSWRMPTQQT